VPRSAPSLHLPTVIWLLDLTSCSAFVLLSAARRTIAPLMPLKHLTCQSVTAIPMQHVHLCYIPYNISIVTPTLARRTQLTPNSSIDYTFSLHLRPTVPLVTAYIDAQQFHFTHLHRTSSLQFHSPQLTLIPVPYVYTLLHPKLTFPIPNLKQIT